LEFGWTGDPVVVYSLYQPMSSRIITLTTDFGRKDYFVGAIHGVILSIEPRARIVDISHEITPFSITEAAFVVAQAARWFPKGTVHMVVVDPGVGSSRRAVLAEADGQRFVAPDNGVLSLVYEWGRLRVRQIENERYFLQPLSRTFHGRDIFAPVAAHLAAGVPGARFGRLIDNYIRGSFAHPERIADRRWRGIVLQIDRFGNLITNFAVQEFEPLLRRGFSLLAGRRRVTSIRQCYAEGKPRELFLIAGSAGYLEIASNQRSAASLVGCAAGAEITLELSS